MVTSSQWDDLDRLTQTIADVGGIAATTAYAYDAAGHLTQVTDPSNLVTSYNFDARGNLEQLNSPDTGVTDYTYDKAGNRISQTDARGVTTTYTYDALNRLTGIAYPDASLNVTYNHDQPSSETGCAASYPVGRITQMIDAEGTTTYCYDHRGNITRKRHASNRLELSTTMTHTVADRIDSITYPSGTRVDYSYGGLGRVSGITWKSAPRATPVTVVANAAYLPFGPLRLLTFGNGSTLAKTYDQNYAIDAITSSIPAGLNLDFEVDVMGNITEISDSLAPPQPDRAYAYDPLYRLTEVTFSAGSLAEFTYSKTGDRLSAAGGGGIVGAYTYVAGTHHLGNAGGIARSYDANGNTVFGIGGFSFRYNDRNRLRVTYQPGDFGAWSYGYNGYGERVAKRHVAEGFAGPIELSDTRYVYNQGGQLLGEYDDSGATLAEYIYLGTLPVAIANNGGPYYILTDHLGTPRQVIDPAAITPVWASTSVWEWSLLGSAFGVHAPNENPDGDRNTFTLNLRFPGQYFDAETGLHYNYFRDYEPGTGRYVESDSIGLRSDVNTYRYAYANPLLIIDLTGLKTWVCSDPIERLPFDPPHLFICNTLPNGQIDCSTQTPDPTCGKIQKALGLCDSDDGDDQFNPEQCSIIADNDCFDVCVLNLFKKPRPRYGLGKLGVDCWQWTFEVVVICSVRCI